MLYFLHLGLYLLYSELDWISCHSTLDWWPLCIRTSLKLRQICVTSSDKTSNIMFGKRLVFRLVFD
jgi:hypothetical protein